MQPDLKIAKSNKMNEHHRHWTLLNNRIVIIIIKPTRK